MESPFLSAARRSDPLQEIVNQAIAIATIDQPARAHGKNFLQRFLHLLPSCESGRQRRSKLVNFLAARHQLGNKLDPGVNRDPYGDVSRVSLRSVGGMNIAARQIQQVSLLELQSRSGRGTYPLGVNG